MNMSDFINSETFPHTRLPTIMIHKEDKYIIVLGTEENKKVFHEYIERFRLPEDANVYYYEPEDYHALAMEIEKSHNERVEREFQEELKNPKINEELKDINKLKDLVNFLIREYEFNEESNIDEYAFGKDELILEARLEAEIKYMKKIVSKYTEM